SSPWRIVGHWRRSDFPGDVAFDARTRALPDRLRRRRQPERSPARGDLVAGCPRAGDCVLRLHFAALCRKGERRSGHAGILLADMNYLRSSYALCASPAPAAEAEKARHVAFKSGARANPANCREMLGTSRALLQGVGRWMAIALGASAQGRSRKR